MDERVSVTPGKTNYLFTLVKFFLFILLFSFLVAFSKEFYREVRGIKDFDLDIFFISLLTCFVFYFFIADLNNLYKTIQKFFFHSSTFSLFVPPVLVLLGLGYLVIPRVFGLAFDKNVFLFFGSFVGMAHLIYAARETRGGTFTEFINYVFVFSILYMLVLVMFEMYVRIAYPIDIGRINVEGAKNGAGLIKSLFMQVFSKT